MRPRPTSLSTVSCAASRSRRSPRRAWRPSSPVPDPTRTAPPIPARTPDMDIDMTALRALEHEKDISFDVVVEAIEAALLSAYHKSHGAHAQARVELDRKTGHVTVWARERLDAEPVEEPEPPAPEAEA